MAEVNRLILARRVLILTDRFCENHDRYCNQVDSVPSLIGIDHDTLYR